MGVRIGADPPTAVRLGRDASPRGTSTDDNDESCRWGAVTATAAIAAVLLLAAVAASDALVSANQAGGPSPGAEGPGSVATSTVAPGCTQGGDVTALLIPNKNPSTSLVAGAHVSVTFEFGVVSSTVSVVGINVRTPTIFVEMPMVGGGSFPLTFSNHTFNMTGATWTTFQYSKQVTAPGTFDSTKNATLSSQKLSVMATTPYGTLKLKWRWSWNVTFANGTYDQGPWSVLEAGQKGGQWLPSIFEPAPFVSLVAESPTDEYIGSVYTMYLGGDVAGRAFYIEFENSTGSVKAQTWLYDNATTNATFEGNITLLGWAAKFVPPGNYLVHIHDSCLAMLYSKRVTMSYSPTATVSVVSSPSTCGGAKINGTVYRNGQSVNLTPSPTPVAFNSIGCRGLTFANFTFKGAIHPDGTNLLQVVGNGTLVVNYRP
jgi:hypothetical protein